MIMWQWDPRYGSQEGGQSSSRLVQVPFMITHDMKQKLRDVHSLKDEHIGQLTPAQAHAILQGSCDDGNPRTSPQNSRKEQRVESLIIHATAAGEAVRKSDALAVSSQVYTQRKEDPDIKNAIVMVVNQNGEQANRCMNSSK
jgi:hypothetical protein